MIDPSNGRIVWYTPYDTELLGNYGMTVQRDKDGKIIPLAAQVCAVWGPNCVNLSVTDANGKIFTCTSRTLLQGDQAPLQGGGYCEWMPYQKGQAAKHQVEVAVSVDTTQATAALQALGTVADQTSAKVDAAAAPKAHHAEVGHLVTHTSQIE